jgi:hypothetical protein
VLHAAVVAGDGLNAFNALDSYLAAPRDAGNNAVAVGNHDNLSLVSSGSWRADGGQTSDSFCPVDLYCEAGAAPPARVLDIDVLDVVYVLEDPEHDRLLHQLGAGATAEEQPVHCGINAIAECPAHQLVDRVMPAHVLAKRHELAGHREQRGRVQASSVGEHFLRRA